MTKELDITQILEGASRILELFPECKDKAKKALNAVDSALNGNAKKGKFSIPSGSVYSLIELRDLLNSIPEKALKKMSIEYSDLNGSPAEEISYADYHYNKKVKGITFFQKDKDV